MCLRVTCPAAPRHRAVATGHLGPRAPEADHPVKAETKGQMPGQILREGRDDTSDTARDFGRLYAEYQPRIRRYLTRIVGEHDADDLTQAVFVKVSQALKNFRGDSAPSTWIYRIAANVAADWRRSASGRQGIRQVHAEGSSDEGWGAPVRGNDVELPVADQVLIRREMNQCIRQVIDGLPMAYRHVITLSDIDGLKDVEIAGRLGVSLATVKIRLHRARGLLRKAMEARCDLYRDARLGLACDAKGRT